VKAVICKDLRKVFGDVAAVDGLNIEIEEGELFGLVGPDGAGKSTSMRLLTSVMEPTSGDAWVFGNHVTRDAAAVKLDIGYVSQRFGLYADLTVAENIDFYADIYCVDRSNLAGRMGELLEFSNLSAFKSRHAGKLSGGMKQKLALVCALIHTPKMLFLDEPTNGVDPVSRHDFWRILNRLVKDGVTILISTPYLDEAERCNTVGLMYEGRLFACDSPDEIKKLLPGRTLEVRVGDPRRALEVLREGMEALSIGLFGETVHIVSEDPRGAREEAEKLLAGNGLEAEVAETAPTLEDVFVARLSGAETVRGRE